MRTVIAVNGTFRVRNPDRWPPFSFSFTLSAAAFSAPCCTLESTPNYDLGIPPGDCCCPQSGFRRRFHVLRAGHEESPLVEGLVPARARGYRDAESQSHRGLVRSQRHFVSRV